MKIYQDLIELGEDENKRTDFVKAIINEHKGSNVYCDAIIAQQYDEHMNVTINNYQKLLYTLSGKAVPDNFSANWKMASRFFHRFILQENQYLLGNGVTWKNNNTANKLGKNFDARLQELGKNALVDGVAFGFFNYNHLEVFRITEFVPLYDEENGALMAGIRFWQIDEKRPLRATLYEVDGYTDYRWVKNEGKILHNKRPYITKIRTSEADGAEIYDFENYPSFPIIPLWGNLEHRSELIGLREQIDCYDLIKSGFANDLDDLSQIFWTIQNAGGMDDVDLAKFIERMHTVRAAVVSEDGATAEAHSIEIPYNSREALLDRLRSDLYEDAMALDTKSIAGGAVTATQIKAAYESLNSKCDNYEYCVRDFLDRLLFVVGIGDEDPVFTRSKIINTQEEIQTIITASSYLDAEYITRKILTLLGDGDLADTVLKNMDEKTLNQFNSNTNSEK